jgi:hypothetical protein
MKRYSLPAGKHYRAFGMSEVFTNENITDKKVEALFKVRPQAKKAFIDSEAQTKEDKAGPDELEVLTKKELHAKYAELAGKPADEKLNKEALLALVQGEVDAKAALG